MNNQLNQNQPINNQNNTTITPTREQQKKVITDFTSTRNTNQVKLIRFKYKVKEPSGKIVEDYFDAESKIDVQSYLLGRGLDIISIEEDKLSTKLGLTASSQNKKMNAKDLNFFLTQLSTYIKSGIPLVDAMEILSRQSKKKPTQKLYRKIVFELNKGVSFSDCLQKQGKVFPKMLINMLKTSEMTGDLTGVLDDMAAYYKRQDSNRKEIINAMTYPSILLVFAAAVLTFVITYVVPNFTSMYDTAGADIPGITKAIMNVSNFVTSYWYFILLGILAIVLIIVLLYKGSTTTKYALQSFTMHIPVVKDIIEYNQLVTFTSTFATLIKHDVFITDSMNILSKITENEIYKKIINAAISNLGKGNGVSVAFKNHWAFPQTAYEMLVTGEKTGKLGEMMEHVAAYYSEEQTNIIARLKSIIEPVMIIGLAGLVGVILLAIVVPMFDIYSTMV